MNKKGPRIEPCGTPLCPFTLKMKKDFCPCFMNFKTYLFPCLGSSGSFIANRIRLNINTSEVVEEDASGADALIFIRFPPGDIPLKLLK